MGHQPAISVSLRLCVNQVLVNGLDAVDDIVHFGAEDGVELGPFCDDGRTTPPSSALHTTSYCG